MKKKGIFRLLAALLLVITVVGVPFIEAYAKPTPKGAPIKIGYDTPVTGPMASLGKYTQMAIEAWGKKVNREGGFLGHPVEIYSYDNESDTTKAVLNVKKLINDHKVHMVAGEASTGLSLAVGPVCAESKCPFISQGGSEVFEIKAKEGGFHHWSFRFTNIRSEAELGLDLQILIKKYGVKKIAILHGEEALGRSFKDVVVKLAPRFGVDIVEVISFPADAVTFGAQISKIKAHPEIQAIPVLNAMMAGPLCVAALRDAGIMVPVVSNATMAGVEFMKMAKVREGYKAAPMFINGSLECVDTLPKTNIMKPILIKCRDFMKKECGINATTMVEILGMTTPIVITDVLTRLLKDRPDIFEKDLATVRSAIRDYFENIKDVNLGFSGVYTNSPDNHSGVHWGTGTVIAQYGKDEKWHYVAGWEILEKLPPQTQ